MIENERFHPELKPVKPIVQQQLPFEELQQQNIQLLFDEGVTKVESRDNLGVDEIIFKIQCWGNADSEEQAKGWLKTYEEAYEDGLFRRVTLHEEQANDAIQVNNEFDRGYGEKEIAQSPRRQFIKGAVKAVAGVVGLQFFNKDSKKTLEKSADQYARAERKAKTQVARPTELTSRPFEAAAQEGEHLAQIRKNIQDLRKIEGSPVLRGIGDAMAIIVTGSTTAAGLGQMGIATRRQAKQASEQESVNNVQTNRDLTRREFLRRGQTQQNPGANER